MTRESNSLGAWWQRLWQKFRQQGRETETEPLLPVFVPEVVIERGRDGLDATVGRPDVEAVNVVHLRQQMMNHLPEAVLAQLATAVSLNYDELPGGKGRRVMALVQAYGEYGRLSHLLHQCQQINPDIDWQPGWGHDVGNN